MGFARVGSNPTVVGFLFGRCVRSFLQVGPSGAMDSASDFGSGGWGFESPLGLLIFGGFFFLLVPTAGGWRGSRQESKFGRVVKALALGASLARGMGSNPIACTLLFVSVTSVMGV